MSDELYSAMEKQRLEAYFDIGDQGSTLYDKERTLTFISTQVYEGTNTRSHAVQR